MNKKFVQLALILVGFFLISGTAPVQATSTGSTSSGYNEPIFKDSMNFTARLENGVVLTAWTPYAPSGFNYYKVIRSTTNPNPVYPDDSYIKADSNPDSSGYVDNSPKSGTAYYRVCSIVKPNRYCSNVVKVENSGDLRICTADYSPVCGKDGKTYSNKCSAGDSAIAYEGECKTNGIEPATLTLSGKIEDGKVRLAWTTDRSCPKGFKIAKSTVNSKPTYPVMSGDTYKYVVDPDAKDLLDGNVDAGKTYHYRVCQYDGAGGCISYSNAVSLAVPGTVEVVTIKEPVVLEPANIILVGTVEEGLIRLEWLVEGTAPKGFKVVISTVNAEPTYPAIEGDTTKYLSNPDTRKFRDFNVSSGKTYYYRVCQYNGDGACMSYSNPVSLMLADDFVSAKEVEPTYVKTTTDSKSALSDITYHQYKGAIEYLKEKAIIEGYDDGTFKPDSTINRAEFMKIVVGAKYSQEYINVSSRSNCFSDVRTAWYAPYVCIAKDEGVVGGYPDGSFKPEQSISFVEAAKILAETYGLTVTKGGNWYEGYVKALQNDNYIPASVGVLDKSITRAEMAELIWRIKEQKKDQASSTLIEGDVIMDSGEYSGWKQYPGDGFTFYHPNWYQGMNWGRVTLTEELDFYQNFGVSGYMAIDTYMHVYTRAGSDLNTSVWFDHPFHSSQEMTINGVKVLKRRYRAPRGTLVNGRAVGENENITIYTYQLPGKVAVLHYFNAHGSENRDVEIFYKIAESFKAQ